MEIKINGERQHRPCEKNAEAKMEASVWRVGQTVKEEEEEECCLFDHHGSADPLHIYSSVMWRKK